MTSNELNAEHLASLRMSYRFYRSKYMALSGGISAQRANTRLMAIAVSDYGLTSEDSQMRRAKVLTAVVIKAVESWGTAALYGNDWS